MTQFGLSDQQQAYVDHVRDLATTKLDASSAGSGHVDRALLRRLGQLGLLRGLFGGDPAEQPRDAAAMQLCLLRETLAGVSTAAETALALQGLGSYPILQSGSPETVERWLPGVVTGEVVAAFALSEPGAGSDAAGLSLRAESDGASGAGWRLFGEKTWISNAPEADVYTVFARTTPDARARGVTAFAVAGDADGLSGEHLDLLAPHAIGRLVFDGVRVTPSDVLGEVDAGFAVAMRTLDLFRPSVGAFAVGMAQAALDATVLWCTEREVHGAPLCEQQSVEHTLAEMATRVQASRLLVRAAAAAYDEGAGPRQVTTSAAMAKLFATETAQWVVDQAVQLHGARALQRGHLLEHLYREVRAPRIYEGASEVQRTVIGRSLVRQAREGSPAVSGYTGSAAFTDDWQHFRFEVVDKVATLTLDRPDKLNALTFETYADLRDLLHELPHRGDATVLVVRGEGRGFCGGGDVNEIIGELITMDAHDLVGFTRMTGEVIKAMRECPVPIVSGIQGIAAGAGSVIALASDFRVVTRSARFAFLFTKVGLSGGDMGAAYLLPRIVGAGRATSLLMLGDTIDAETADRYGLVSELVDDDKLDEAVHRLARRLADGPTLGYAQTKSLITRELDMSLGASVELDAMTQALLMTTADHAEFHAAFNEKRPPALERAMTERLVCLVTGAGKGIGRATAEALSARGHRVALASRNAEELQELAAALPGPALAVPTDVTVPEQVEAMFATVEGEWGPVQVLVLSAGVAAAASVADTTDETWQRMLEVNLTAPFRCLRRALPSMTEHGFGRVVVVASVVAKRGEPMVGAYAASKHGVLGLVRSASHEVASRGVTVNAVCPGYVDTPMTDDSVEKIAARTGKTLEQARELLAGRQPNRRLVQPGEVASTVLLCVENGAVNGQGINIDGGAVQS